MGKITTVTGEVESVNERGIKIDGSWLNFSKFSKVDAPDRGDRVTIKLDGTFIQEITVTGSAPASSGSSTSGGSIDNRSQSIVRQVSIKAASHLLSGQPDVNEEMVISAATEFEAWINRSDASESPLEDLPF